MNKTHGLRHHPIYNVWCNLRNRCYNKKVGKYKDWGGRGIAVCERWHDPQNFFDDMLPTYKEGLQIDRIDNDGGYSPSNCRWVTVSQNCRNRRNNITLEFKGRKILLVELAKELNIPYHRLYNRHRNNIPLDQSLHSKVG